MSLRSVLHFPFIPFITSRFKQTASELNYHHLFLDSLSPSENTIFSSPPPGQDGPEHPADPGVDEERRHQHQAGGGGPRDGASHACLPARRQGGQINQ